MMKFTTTILLALSMSISACVATDDGPTGGHIVAIGSDSGSADTTPSDQPVPVSACSELAADAIDTCVTACTDPAAFGATAMPGSCVSVTCPLESGATATFKMCLDPK